MTQLLSTSRTSFATVRTCILLFKTLAVGPVLAQTTVTNGISSVSPFSASQGAVGLAVTLNLSSGLVPPVPPAGIMPSSVTIGTNVGTSVTHASQYIVTAQFNIPPTETLGLKDVAVTFPRPTGGPLTYNRLQAFQVVSNGSTAPVAGFTATPTNGAAPLAVNFTDTSTGTITNRLWNFGDGATSTATNPSHVFTNAGSFTVSLTVFGPGGSNTLTRANVIVAIAPSASAWRFAVVSDTHVTNNPIILPEIVSSVIQDNARLLLMAGDLVNSGSNTPSATLQRMLTNWWNALAPARAAGITVLPLRGNHENDATDSLTAWNNFFSGSRGLPANGPAGEMNLTYSVTHSNALFIGLDHYANLHRVNQSWLDQQLTNNTRPHVFVFGHESAFKVFHTDCLGLFPDARNTFWQSLSNAGAKVCFCGHDHFFDVARIDDGDGNVGNDLHQFTVGTGGGTIFTQHNYNGTNSPYTPVGLYHKETNGYLLVEISGPGSNDLGVTLTWKQRAYDAGSTSYVYVAASEAFSYTARGHQSTPAPSSSYSIVDTGQTNCFNNSSAMTEPAAGQPFFGQDAQLAGNAPRYVDNGDGTVSDLVTGLMWQQDPGAKVSFPTAVSGAAALTLGGHTDWRLPTIKELYSLILFSGLDASPCMAPGAGACGAAPFLNTNYFRFQYGNTNAGERVIDAQYWSSTEYVSTTMGGSATVFGVNFADGRIKGYPRNGFTEFCRYVRGNTSYGLNNFTNHGDGTITDKATWLMWARDDSGGGLNWSNALAWVQAKNASNHLGYHDWRLPNAKELQSIVDYTRSPDTTRSAAIDPLFNCTAILDEGGSTNWPFYWTSTTHEDANHGGTFAVYVCFGEALGWMTNQSGGYVLQDVHGAGAQRSDPKTGSASSYPHGHGPQGDVVRVSNFVRLVRDTSLNEDTVGDGLPDWWRRQYFGSGTTTNSSSCATCDPDHDGADNYHEYVADTNPANALSCFRILSISNSPDLILSFQASASRFYTLYSRTNLADGVWSAVAGRSNVAGIGGVMTFTNPLPGDGQRFFRVSVQTP